MKLENFKSNWGTIGSDRKGQDELWMMTKVENHPLVKKLRIKFLIESIILAVFIFVYYDGFDGHTKPFWANLILIISAVSYVIIRFVGWYILKDPINGDDLKKSLSRFHQKLKGVALGVVATSLLFGVTIITFFTSSIDFTTQKYISLAIMIIALIVLVYLSSRNWIKRVSIIKKTIKEFSSKTK